MALYNLKPASRSLVLEALGSEALPYIWIASAITLFLLISIYHRILDRYGRVRIVLGSCIAFIVTLVLIRLFLEFPNKVVPVIFYVFVDILGVVLVEQFWSLTNSIYSTAEGKRWYGMVGTGGLVGGMLGGGSAAIIVKYTPLQTADLLLVAALIIGIIYSLTLIMTRYHLYDQQNDVETQRINETSGWQTLIHNRYLLLIAAALLMAQLVSPLVEYQFLRIIEIQYPELESRTTILSLFFSLMSAVAIAINILVTPFILRNLGVLAGLLVQPITLAITAYGFVLQPTLWPAATMKISDRGLSYSINRASKEILYIPIAPDLMYRAKAWIDMFGYRIFKIFGSLLILILTQWTAIATGYADLSWVILGFCLIWVLVLINVHSVYKSLTTARVSEIS